LPHSILGEGPASIHSNLCFHIRKISSSNATQAERRQQISVVLDEWCPVVDLWWSSLVTGSSTELSCFEWILASCCCCGFGEIRMSRCSAYWACQELIAPPGKAKPATNEFF
jgi:hypothetical protein